MSDDYYIEFSASIGPVDPPYALHTFEEGRVRSTAHGELVRELHDAVCAVHHEADTGARIVTQDTLDERHLDEQLLKRQGDLLTATANALKGDPGPLTLHDWSDLPSVAAAVVAERDAARTELAALLQLIDDSARAVLASAKPEDNHPALERLRHTYGKEGT